MPSAICRSTLRAHRGNGRWQCPPTPTLRSINWRPTSSIPTASCRASATTGEKTGRENAATIARRSAASGSHLPYWALVWPSGLALAEALLAHPEALRSKRALELGCGLGTTATAALLCGARLEVADCFAETLLFCRYNTLRNAGRQPRTLLVNWRTDAGRAACLAGAPFDALLAADILYEPEDLEPLLQLVPRLLAPDGAFWLAEPGRRVSQAFVRAALARGWRDDSHHLRAHLADGR